MKKSKLPIIIAAAVALIAVIVCTIFFFMGGKNSALANEAEDFDKLLSVKTVDEMSEFLNYPDPSVGTPIFSSYSGYADYYPGTRNEKNTVGDYSFSNEGFVELNFDTEDDVKQVRINMGSIFTEEDTNQLLEAIKINCGKPDSESKDGNANVYEWEKTKYGSLVVRVLTGSENRWTFIVIATK